MGCCCAKTEIDPEKKRGCTDIIVLIVFVLFWGGMAAIAGYASKNGDVCRVIYGADSYGNACGRQNKKIDSLEKSGRDLREKPFVMSFDILNPRNSGWICVEKCPEKSIFDRTEMQTYAIQEKVRLCSYEINVEDYRNETNAPLGPCPVFPIFKSKPLFRRCLPVIPEIAKKNNSKIANKVIEFFNDIDAVQQVFSDLMLARKEMAILSLVAFLISLLSVFLIHLVAALIIYLVYGMVIIGSFAAFVALWVMYAKSAVARAGGMQNFTDSFDIDVENDDAVFTYAIISTIVLVVVFFLVCCCWGRTALVVDLFQQSGRCVRATPLLLLQPFWTFLCLGLLMIYWCYVGLLLATATNMSLLNLKKSMNATVDIKLVDYTIDAPVKYIWWYHFIGLIWTAEFVLACQQIVISGVVALWYFSKDRGSLRCTICKSIYRLIRYHLGSVALGALVITLVKIPRYILMYIEKKLQGAQNAILKAILSCCICCLYCFEKCLKYINQNAYTIIFVEGRSFCPAAIQAFEILVTHAVQVSTINLIGDFILFLGKCGVTAMTGFFALIVFKYYKEGLHFFALPVLIVCVIAFFIAHCFFSLYEMVIDTVFLCYCENERKLAQEQKEKGSELDRPTSGRETTKSHREMTSFMNQVAVAEKGQPENK